MFYFTLCRGEEEGPENRRDLLQPEKGLIILSRPNLEGQCSRGRTSLPHSMGIVGLKQVKWLCETTGPAVAHLLDDLAPAVDGAVVDHVHDGHAQVAADAEGDAEAQAAHDGDNVAARETKAGAIHDRRVPGLRRHRAPISTQLQRLCTFLPLLQKTERQQGSDTDVQSPAPSSHDTTVQGKICFSRPGILSLHSLFPQKSSPRLPSPPLDPGIWTSVSISLR